MRKVKIGKQGLVSAAIGLGCMGMSEFYGHADPAESRRTLARALELGVTMFDTADMYGRGDNERLVGEFLQGRRERVLLCTKFGVRRDPMGPSGSTYDRDLDNSPAYLRACCEASLKRLGTDHIDLYYVHRLDPTRPVEEVAGALADLVRAGKIGGIGFSEIDAATLRRAHAVHPVSALQSEYSLFTRDIEAEVLPTCRELGVALVAYSPLGRGILTGALQSTQSLDANDLRLSSPRFTDANLARNLALLERVQRIATAHGCTLGQVALAWLLAQGDDVVPIPGTKRIKYLEENTAAVDLQLSAEELAAIDAAVAPAHIAGSRNWVPGSAEARS